MSNNLRVPEWGPPQMGPSKFKLLATHARNMKFSGLANMKKR